MKPEQYLSQRDAKKLALTNNARLRRVARRKLENKQSATPVTEAMVTTALAQRNINQVDELSRRTNYQYQQRQAPQKKFDVIALSQLPSKALKRNVLWLSMAQQDASSGGVPLSTELECFATYVQVFYFVHFPNFYIVEGLNIDKIHFSLTIRNKRLERACCSIFKMQCRANIRRRVLVCLGRTLWVSQSS